MKVSKKDVAEYVEIANSFWGMDASDLDELIKTARKKHETADRVFGENEELPKVLDVKIMWQDGVTADEACQLLRDKGVEVVEDGDV